MTEPFILLDDARPEGASDARLYRAPVEVVIARRVSEVEPALERIEALRQAGHHMAGYLAYEAGLALEPRLAPLAACQDRRRWPAGVVRCLCALRDDSRPCCPAMAES